MYVCVCVCVCVCVRERERERERELSKIHTRGVAIIIYIMFTTNIKINLIHIYI